MGFSLSNLFKSDARRMEQRGVVGVDIGASSIKIVQVHMQHKVATLDTYGELQLGPYGGVDIGRTVRLRTDKLIEALLDILRESSASAKSVALAISYNSSFVSVVEIKETDPEKITAMMPVEAKKYIPVSLSEVTLDWFPIASRDAGKIMQLLLVAIHNDAVKRYDAMVSGAAVDAVCTEVEMFSTVRSSVPQGDGEVAIIDLGASSTKLYIVRKGLVRKTYSVPMSGVGLTEALTHELGIEFGQAEELKRTVGLMGVSEDPRVQKLMVSYIDRGLREIHKVIKMYEGTEGKGVQKVLMSGGGSLLQGLGTYAHDFLSLPVQFVDPFAKVSHPVFLEDTLREAGPIFAVALGAALRGLLQ